MDLRAFYNKIRSIEKEIENRDVVVISLATPDGGKEGIAIVVNKLAAAKLVVEGKARLATAAESDAYYKREQEDFEKAKQDRSAAQMSLSIIPEADLKNLRSVLQKLPKGS